MSVDRVARSLQEAYARDVLKVQAEAKRMKYQMEAARYMKEKEEIRLRLVLEVKRIMEYEAEVLDIINRWFETHGSFDCSGLSGVCLKRFKLLSEES